MADHYTYYDDPAGALDDADYVEHAAKDVVADIANLDSCADISIGASDTVNAVYCYARMYGDDAEATAGMQVKDNGTAYKKTGIRVRVYTSSNGE